MNRIRKAYPRLGEPITLTSALRAVFIHMRTLRDEEGHVLPAGAQVREEVDDLPRGERVIVQYAHDGAMGRYWVASEELDRASSAYQIPAYVIPAVLKPGTTVIAVLDSAQTRLVVEHVEPALVCRTPDGELVTVLAHEVVPADDEPIPFRRPA